MKTHSNHLLTFGCSGRFFSKQSKGRCIAGVSILAVMLVVSGAQATIHTVTKDTDNNPSDPANAGELRREVNLAAPGDTIEFDAAFFSTPRRILLQPALYGPLIINKNLIVTGPGPANLAVDAGGMSNRVFTLGVGSPITVNMSGLTITNGDAPAEAISASDYQFRGGGIFSLNCFLTLSNCWIVGNRASNTLYSVALGGGVCSVGAPLQMLNCVVSNNVTAALATTKGGGILASNTGAGVMLSNCVIAANAAGPGGAGPSMSTVLGGGLAVEGAHLTVADCTLANNRVLAASVAGSMARGGGFYGLSTLPQQFARVTVAGNAASGYFTLGGGLWLAGAPSILQNCTVSGNSLSGVTGSSGGGGIFGFCTLTNCTVASNSITLGSGGGLIGSSAITLKNTIVAGNSAPAYADVAGNFVSLGHNLIERTNGVSAFASAGDLAGTIVSPIDPILGPLQDNGGLTWTHALLVGSPAIDAGDNLGAPLTDQRGFPRPGGSTLIVDIGAYEAGSGGAPLMIFCSPNLETNTIGCDTTRTLSTTTELPPPGTSGGSGPVTMKVKFEGESLDYLVPPSLTFSVGVTNLIWTATAGAESVSCTQKVTVVQGINQAPTITLQPPAPTALATNSQLVVNFMVSDAETLEKLGNLSTLSVNSSSGGLLTLESTGPDGSGLYSLTLTAGSVSGTENITNIVTDDCGASDTNIFTVQIAEPPTISDIPNQTVNTNNLISLTVPFHVSGSGSLPVGASVIPPPPVDIPGLGTAYFVVGTTTFGEVGSDRYITQELGIPVAILGYPPAFPAIFEVTVTVTNDVGLTASDSFNVTVVEPVSLSILSIAPTMVQVSWPSPSTGWVLQQNTNGVSSVNWSNVTDTISDDGTTKSLTINPPTGNRFYRLFLP